MPIRSRHSGSRGVSVDIETPWAAQGLTSAVTNLANMARFQQRQLMEKEQKLLQLYDQQQQRAHQVAQRGSAGSNTSKGSGSGTTTQSVTRTTTTSHSTSNSQGGKVRQMFDERRQTTVKGIDRSYPLEPLENKPRKTTGPATQKNGNTVSSRHSVTVKRTIRADANGNVNNGKPVINYHEEVTRETFGPKLVHQQDDLDEFYNENDLAEWNGSNQEPNIYGISGNDRGRAVERTKYGSTKKETSLKQKSETISPGAAPRKQESRTYRNMIKIELGRTSPEWTRTSRESLRGMSKSPERNVESGTRSPVQMQKPISNGNYKIDENKRNISGSSVRRSRNRSAEGIFNKSRSGRGSKTSPREDTPSPREKSKITEVKGDSVPRKASSLAFESSENVKEAGGSPRVQSPIFRERVKVDEVRCEKTERSRSPQSFLEKLDIRRSRSPSSELNESRSFISLKRLDKPASSSPDLEDDVRYYPRRKSEFEKSRIFRKLQEELDRDSPEDYEKSPNDDNTSYRKDKSPSPPKYNASFFRIKEYPRRTSEFEKSDTFIKLRSTLNEDEKRARRSSRGRSATPPVIVKSSYEKIKEYPSKRRNSKTTFHKLQEDLDRSSPECKPPTSSNIYDDFPKKSELEKSRIFKKLQMELSSSPEPIIETHKHHSPTRISLKNNEVQISSNLTKPRPVFEKLKSVELLKDHLLLNEKKNESNLKFTLEDIDKEVSPKKSRGETPHKVIKKDKPRAPSPKTERVEHIQISKKSKNARSLSPEDDSKVSKKKSFSAALIHECSPITSQTSNEMEKHENTYERTDSVESALRTFNSIDNVTADEIATGPRKASSDSRRSSLHAATASWTMKTRSANQHIHENVSTPSKTAKLQGKTKSKSLKASKASKVVKELRRSSSPSSSCRKRLFTDSESDVASEGTKSSGKTITIETFEKTTRMSSPPTAAVQPLKILRSIEDIRNSMTRDNVRGTTANESTSSITPKVTIRIISPTTARRTGYINQFVEFGVSKSRVSSEINVKPARRIEKTQSPDDPRRITSNETKSVSRNNSDITLRPTSRDSNRGKQYENTQSVDVVDYYDDQTRQSPSENTTVRKSSAFVVELEGEPRSKPIFGGKKSPNDRQSPEKVTSQSRQKVSSARPASAVSTNSSSSSTQGANSPASKSRMATKTRGAASGNRTPSAKSNIPASNTDSGLPGCKICGRKFAPDRLSLHEQICAKTTQKKRKTFDPVVQRVKGTELEPFVKKLGKKGSDKKAKKPEVKSNWRRKHEDFINAIRSAKQMQAHLAAGGKLSDLPPPPASDTSDYIQCPYCGRKFNQGAAERHIPKCEHMLHNKPNPRAPPKPRR
ncbi:serine/arginine repetitive matrix protein 2 [Diachasma alloeum]|uniref:serine/arginine repetitive matrix protein 2 n=1 Tax=Diachasma alloeum TaxID=454923 RepID=UPI0007383934|nr:serine/arginine repetitive matrix protein 2 [Diachasma alloeum]